MRAVFKRAKIPTNLSFHGKWNQILVKFLFEKVKQDFVFVCGIILLRSTNFNFDDFFVQRNIFFSSKIKQKIYIKIGLLRNVCFAIYILKYPKIFISFPKFTGNSIVHFKLSTEIHYQRICIKKRSVVG